MSTLQQPIKSEENLHMIERICNSQTNLKQSISQRCTILMTLEERVMPPLVAIKGKELGSQLKEQQKSKVLREVYRFSVDINTIEMNYKCL